MKEQGTRGAWPVGRKKCETGGDSTSRPPESAANWIPHTHPVSSSAGEEHREVLKKGPRNAGGQAGQQVEWRR